MKYNNRKAFAYRHQSNFAKISTMYNHTNHYMPANKGITFKHAVQAVTAKLCITFSIQFQGIFMLPVWNRTERKSTYYYVRFWCEIQMSDSLHKYKSYSFIEFQTAVVEMVPTPNKSKTDAKLQQCLSVTGAPVQQHSVYKWQLFPGAVPINDRCPL